MKIISIVNNKGGVGKTTSSQNIAAALHRFAKQKVLLIDLDSQASLTKCFGIMDSSNKKNCGNFILGDTPFQDVVVSVAGVDVLPSSPFLNSMEDSMKSAAVFPFNLKIALEKIKDQYDYVIIDCPPTLSSLTRIALISCNYYYVPLQAEYLSYEGLRNFLFYSNELRQISPNTTLGGVFATRYNPNIKKKLSNDLIEATRKQLGDMFMNTYIRDNISLSEAQARGTDIFDYAPDSNGAVDYYSLTKEILNKK